MSKNILPAFGLAGLLLKKTIVDPQTKAENAARDLALNQKNAQDAQIALLEKNQADEKAGTESARVRDEARKLQKQKAASASGRRSTILTSPLGAPDVVTGQAKTALGT